MSSPVRYIPVALLAAVAVFWGCNRSGAPVKEAVADPQSPGSAQMRLTSSAFAENGAIPVKYTCHGENVSPPLAWSDAPKETKSFALIVNDPDAPSGDFTHWVLYNLPASVSSLPEGVPSDDRAQRGAQGSNGFGKIGYGGPCPPSGTHRYQFTLFALDAELGLQPRAVRAQVEAAMHGHILAQTQLTGKYGR